MRILFVKDHLVWPRSSGHDVHTYSIMRALGQRGHDVGLLTRAPVAAAAVDGIRLARRYTMAGVRPTGAEQGSSLPLSWTQERFRSYWGVDPAAIRAVAATAESFAADAVVAVNLDALPYLADLRGSLRVWYAADESLSNHWSQVRLGRRGAWANFKQGLINGLYERAYRRLVDRVWVVSEGDGRAMRWVAGMREVDVVANGVETEHYRPQSVPTIPNSCVFWGRLDAGPNVQALEWFCRRVWPTLYQRVPDARFTIYGFKPTSAVTALVGEGITLTPDLPDLRASVAAHQVVVLPFVSGGGIKNKLLEAAGLGKAIVASPRACSGLRGRDELPLLCRRGAGVWVKAIRELWSEDDRRRQLGLQARRWVETHHTWEAAAQAAVEGLTRSFAPHHPVTTCPERGRPTATLMETGGHR